MSSEDWHCLLCAACAYTCIALLLALEALFLAALVLCSPLLFLVSLCKWGRAAARHIRPTPDNLAYFAERVCHFYPNMSVHDDDTPVCLDGRIVASMHAIVAQRRGGDARRRRRALLFVHGTGGSSLSFGRAMDILSLDHAGWTMYAVDLPAFNPRSPVFLRQQVQRSVLQFYCTCLQAFVEKHKLKKVIVVGHSFGGFVASEFSRQHPECVDKLVLVNPAGVLPTLGDTGAYWASFFKISPFQSAARGLGSTGSFAITSALRASLSSASQLDSMLASYQLLASPSSFGDHIVAAFVHMGRTCMWTKPAILSLLSSKVPIAFIFGEHDAIVPSHQGNLVSMLSCTNVPVIVMDGAHSPMAESPALFCTALMLAVNHARASGRASLKLAKEVPSSSLIKSPFSASSFSRSITGARVRSLYDLLLALCREHGGSPGGKTWAERSLFYVGRSSLQ